MRRLLFRLAVLLLGSLPLLGETLLPIPFVPQQKNGCGAASVAMVMHYWAAAYPQLELPAPDPEGVYEQLYRPELRSITLSAMSQFLKDHGYNAFTIRGEISDLESQIQKRRPVIVAMKKGSRANIHFAVLADLDADWVWLNDPTKRKARRMKRGKFERTWSQADRWLLLAVPAGPA